MILPTNLRSLIIMAVSRKLTRRNFQNKKVLAKKYVKPIKKKTSKSVDEIEIIDIDDDEPNPNKIDAASCSPTGSATWSASR